MAEEFDPKISDDLRIALENAAEDMTRFAASHGKSSAQYLSASKAYETALADAKKGILGYTEAMKKAKADLGSSTLGLAKSLASGGNSVSEFGSAADAAGAALTLALGPVGLLGKALVFAVGAVTEFAKAAIKQGQELLDGYSCLLYTSPSPRD